MFGLLRQMSSLSIQRSRLAMTFHTTSNLQFDLTPKLDLNSTPTLQRARVGTRIRKRKIALANKKKKEERLRKNPPPIPYKIQLLMKRLGIKGKVKPLRADETKKTFAVDNCFRYKDFCYIRYDFNEAIKNVKNHYHPSLLNRPDDLLYAKVELNMKTSKTDKYMDEFSKMVPIIHPFDENMRSKNICVFAEDPEDIKNALDVGGYLAGGQELIEDLIKGRINIADIDHFVCHDSLLLKMKLLTGLLRDKTPNKKLDGTVGTDVVKMVQTFRTGIDVKVKKMVPSYFVAEQPDYGYTTFPLGKLTADPDKLKENLESLLNTLIESSPKRKGGFVTRVNLELMDGPHYASFSIHHPLVHDEKREEFVKALQNNSNESASG